MRLRSRSVLVTMLALCSVAAGAQPAPAGAQGVQIIDHQGFGRPVVAATVQIPAGWQARGGVNWDRRTPCVGNQMRLEWQAASPDGRHALEIMHGFSWQVQGTQIAMNPCPALPFRSTRDFLNAVVQQRRPGALFVAYRHRADIAQAARTAAPPSQGAARQSFDAGELEISYPSGAATVREVLSATVNFSELQGNVVGGTSMVFAQRAAGGPVDVQVGQRITASLKADPQWLSMMQASLSGAEKNHSTAQRQQIDRWHASEMGRINAQGAADRAAIRAQTQREIGQIHSQTQANTQDTNDRMHRRNLEGVGEYNTYRDSSGNTVRSSIHGGERVLRNGDGSYSSTRDPYYNPAGSEELRRVR